VNDSLSEYAYNAELTGLSYLLIADNTGLCIALSGYNDKMAVLTRHVVQRLKDLVFKPERLEVMKEQVRYSLTLSCRFKAYSPIYSSRKTGKTFF